MLTSLEPRTERFFLLTLAGIQFSHILDFMIDPALRQHTGHSPLHLGF